MPIVKIVPPNTGPNQTLAQGTKVLVDGVELEGVQKIVLTAEVNELWRAEIHCLASFDAIHADGRITTEKPSLWAGAPEAAIPAQGDRGHHAGKHGQRIPMKISELIAELEKAKAEHGDVPVYVSDGNDSQTWRVGLEEVRYEADPKDWAFERLPSGIAVLW